LSEFAEPLLTAPYTRELALGAGQLDFRSFDLSVLEHYRNDPRYFYETNAIFGKISIHDEYYETGALKPHDQILLQSFGFAYDKELSRAVAVFIRYLHRLSPEHQQIWRAKQVAGDYCLHPDYEGSCLQGSWGTKVPIFSAFCRELSIINEMCTLMGYPPIIRKTFREKTPKEFSFLLRPTSKEFNNFVHLLDKMMSDNLSIDFFKCDITTEQDSTRDDGKVVVSKLGSIALLEKWIKSKFRATDSAPIDEMIATFKKVRKLRQKPAHTVDTDSFDQKHFKEQRLLMIEAYNAVRTLRLIFANHPNVRAKPPHIEKNLVDGMIWDI
jgi:hypothetical protein